MSQEQINKNNHIVDILNDIQDNVHDIQKEADPLNTIEQRAVSIIRALRQGIERLRRIADEGDTLHVPYPRTLAEANQWPKDELAFVMWQFWDWVSGEGCPAETCKDFPCKYRQKTKADCEENLQNGDLDEEGYRLQQENGFYADKWCDEEQTGCWGQYYMWCYRHGYNPVTGKEVER